VGWAVQATHSPRGTDDIGIQTGKASQEGEECWKRKFREIEGVREAE
jgi:hypothetical protein